MTGKIDARLKELDIALPTPPAPVASYVPYVVSGKHGLHLRPGHDGADGLKYVGIVGKEFRSRTARRRRGCAPSMSSRR